jgi:hypothetical protein
MDKNVNTFGYVKQNGGYWSTPRTNESASYETMNIQFGVNKNKSDFKNTYFKKPVIRKIHVWQIYFYVLYYFYKHFRVSNYRTYLVFNQQSIQRNTKPVNERKHFFFFCTVFDVLFLAIEQSNYDL